MNSTLSNEELQLIQILEQNTGAQALDVMNEEDCVTFIVKNGDLGRAIGKDGANITRLKKNMGKNVELVEYSEERKTFLENLFKPAKIQEFRFEENGMILRVDTKDKGLAIGRGGSRIKRARELMKRHFGIQELKIV
ncbi:MAG: NusA-like transcription termination signal-binding factor [Candidatus Micrarchaeota archaeon]